MPCCSTRPAPGSGTIRRDPDIRWRRQEADLAPLAATQREMLEQLAAVVRARRPADLRDLLERAGGERGGRRRIPRHAIPNSARRAARLFEHCRTLAALLDDGGRAPDAAVPGRTGSVLCRVPGRRPVLA